MIPRSFAEIRSSVAAMIADLAPPSERFQMPLDVPALFRWVVGSVLTHDGWSVIVPTGASNFLGAWERVREDDKGADLLRTTTTIAVGEKRWRRIPVALLIAHMTITISTVNAAAGDWILITREDVGNFMVAFTNGGPAAGTVVTLPPGTRCWVLMYFDGTNWLHRSSALSL